MSPETRQRSQTVLNLLGGLVATSLLKRGMQAALAPANTNAVAAPFPALRALLLPVAPESSAKQAAEAMYGAGWLAMVAMAGAHLPIRNVKIALAGGAALGALVWAVGQFGGRPETRAQRLARRDPKAIAQALGTHLFYGLAAATPTALRAAFEGASVSPIANSE